MSCNVRATFVCEANRRRLRLAQEWPGLGLLIDRLNAFIVDVLSISSFLARQRSQTNTDYPVHQQPVTSRNHVFVSAITSYRPGAARRYAPADSSLTRGGSTSVRGRVRSPHTAKLQAASVLIAYCSCAMGQTDGQTDRRIAVSLSVPPPRTAGEGHNNSNH